MRVFLCLKGDSCSAEICLFLKEWFIIAGPTCVPRRIYNITTGGSQLFVAVEGTAPCPASPIPSTSHVQWMMVFFHCILSLSLISPYCQRALVCASSVAVQPGPVHCRVLTVRATRRFILKGLSGLTPAASAAAWWRWGPTHLRNNSLALYARGRLHLFLLALPNLNSAGKYSILLYFILVLHYISQGNSALLTSQHLFKVCIY